MLLLHSNSEKRLIMKYIPSGSISFLYNRLSMGKCIVVLLPKFLRLAEKVSTTAFSPFELVFLTVNPLNERQQTRTPTSTLQSVPFELQK